MDVYSKMIYKWLILVLIIIIMSFVKENFYINRYILLGIFSLIGLCVYYIFLEKNK